MIGLTNERLKLPIKYNPHEFMKGILKKILDDSISRKEKEKIERIRKYLLENDLECKFLNQFNKEKSCKLTSFRKLFDRIIVDELEKINKDSLYKKLLERQAIILYYKGKFCNEGQKKFFYENNIPLDSLISVKEKNYDSRY